MGFLLAGNGLLLLFITIYILKYVSHPTFPELCSGWPSSCPRTASYSDSRAPNMSGAHC